MVDAGVLVAELCLGKMTFGGKGFWEDIGRQQDEVNALTKRALDSGINFIDTANLYSYSESDRLLAACLDALGVNRNELYTIFERPFDDFCEQYDEKYASTCGRYRLERILQPSKAWRSTSSRTSTCSTPLISSPT